MITKELNFPTVYNKDTITGYGGNQEWFSEKIKRKAGCGCTSGANLAAYYASRQPEMSEFIMEILINSIKQNTYRLWKRCTFT